MVQKGWEWMKYLPNCFGNRFQALTDTSLSLNVQASFQDIVCLVPDPLDKANIANRVGHMSLFPQFICKFCLHYTTVY